MSANGSNVNRGGESLGDAGAGSRVVQMQRERVLEAVVKVIAERGYEGASVSLVCARAKISRRTFYELFGSFEDCFLAILDRGMEVMAGVMLRAFAQEEDWLDALLAAEAAVLGFLDSEPLLARVLLVEALGAGSWALARRQDNVAELQGLIVGHFKDTPLGGNFPPLAAAGVMASLLGLMHEHLLRREPAPLISLLGPLMGVITTPYLPPEQVAQEIRRGEELARKLQIEHAAPPLCPQPARRGAVEGEFTAYGAVELPALLRNAKAARARLCVLYLGEHSGASNRQIAAGVGIVNAGQISRLLQGLERCGVASKVSYGPGKRNAWRLTPYGQEIAAHLEPREYER